jgi:hypothetical protein
MNNNNKNNNNNNLEIPDEKDEDRKSLQISIIKRLKNSNAKKPL